MKGFPFSFEDNLSGRAETFGLLSAMQFLLRYSAQFPTWYCQKPTATVYCENQGTIKRIIKWLLAPAVTFWRPTTTNDYDMFHKIECTTKQLFTPITILFKYIKSHKPCQKKLITTSYTKRRLWPQSNSVFLRLAHRTPTTENPAIPSNAPQCIHNKIIICKLQQCLGHAATKQTTRSICTESMTGPADGKGVNPALQKFSPNKQTILYKLLHEWLLTHEEINYRANMPHMQQRNRDILVHFLECQHPEHQQVFSKLHRTLPKQHQKYKTDLHTDGLV